MTLRLLAVPPIHSRGGTIHLSADGSPWREGTIRTGGMGGGDAGHDALCGVRGLLLAGPIAGRARCPECERLAR